MVGAGGALAAMSQKKEEEQSAALEEVRPRRQPDVAMRRVEAPLLLRFVPPQPRTQSASDPDVNRVTCSTYSHVVWRMSCACMCVRALPFVGAGQRRPPQDAHPFHPAGQHHSRQCGQGRPDRKSQFSLT